MNLAILQAEAREIAQRQATRLQAAIDGNRDLTAEEETADAADTTRLAELQTQIQRAQQLQARLSTASQLALTTPANPPAQTQRRVEPTVRTNESGFRNMAEFGAAVRLANPAAGAAFRMDERLAAPANVITEQGDNAGSFLVPADLRDELINLAYDDSGVDPVLNLITPLPTASNRVQGLGSENTPWGNGGVQAKWRAEAEQMQPSRLGLVPRETKLNELYVYVLASEEVLEDAPRLQYLLTTESGAAIRWKTSDAFMWADGVEKPQGWMTSNALVTVAKEAGQPADTILRQNVGKMYSRQISPGRAVWLANSDIMPTIMDLKSDLGQPVWFPNYQDAPGGTLLGRPVYFTEHAATVGDLGDLQFVDPNGYEAYRKQNGVTFADSIHLYFDYNIRAFRWIVRTGGQPMLSKPREPARGNATKSHFVALAARA